MGKNGQMSFLYKCLLRFQSEYDTVCKKMIYFTL